MMNRINDQLGGRNRASLCLLIVSLVMTAIMMHPTFASLVVLAVDTGLLFALRFVAHLEGRGIAAQDHGVHHDRPLR
jgi:hypothetical protein